MVGAFHAVCISYIYEAVGRCINFPGKSLQKVGGGSLQNSLVIPPKILEVYNSGGEFLTKFIIFPAWLLLEV